MNVYPIYLPCCSSCNRPLIHIAMDVRMGLERGETVEYLFENVYSDLLVCCRKELMSPSPFNMNMQSDKAVNFYRLGSDLPREKEGVNSPYPRGYLALIPSRRFAGAFTFLEDKQTTPVEYRPTPVRKTKVPLELEEGEELIGESCALTTEQEYPSQPGVPLFPSTLRFTAHPKIIQGKVVNQLSDRLYPAW